MFGQSTSKPKSSRQRVRRNNQTNRHAPGEHRQKSYGAGNNNNNPKNVVHRSRLAVKKQASQSRQRRRRRHRHQRHTKSGRHAWTIVETWGLVVSLDGPCLLATCAASNARHRTPWTEIERSIAVLHKGRGCQHQTNDLYIRFRKSYCCSNSPRHRWLQHGLCHCRCISGTLLWKSSRNLTIDHRSSSVISCKASREMIC